MMSSVTTSVSRYMVPTDRFSESETQQFALMRNAVGDIIGSDVLRALLALAEPNVGRNLELLSQAIHELRLAAVRQLEAEIAMRAA